MREGAELEDYAQKLRFSIKAAYEYLEAALDVDEDIICTFYASGSEFSLYLGAVGSSSAGYLQVTGRSIESYAHVIFIVPADHTTFKFEVTPLKHSSRLGFSGGPDGS
ncbi:hypothetical protein P6U16_08685 [Rhizobium sp. 32-5/1]|uniref:hypothetical protein n=1 Tax=Rhizobium sp. 32-5/1 TaxID=3019602 RepID=UPI00240D5E5C|nr:hypothetical protein [Rhizobium sp. 32-5/1]WEZ84631.1 hypothetical protein P6U16_08685 [Rhizobium sp. 32-5/1]